MGVETILRASRLTATPAMTDDNQLSFNLPSVSRKKVRAAFDGGRLSSDSGVMLLALADRRRAVADTLAALIADHRDPSHITHTVADILRARMLAIGCGYPDGNDFDRLRFDPAFVAADGDVGAGPVPADAPDQATEQLANLHARWRLAGTQNHRNRSTRRRIIDMDRQEAALIIIVGVPLRQLLVAVHNIDRGTRSGGS